MNKLTLGRLLLVVLLIMPAHARTQEPDVFAPVPAHLRARLIERLKTLLEYQSTQQWGKLYSLIYKPTLSKEKYLQGLSEYPPSDVLLDFEPKSVTLLHSDSGWYFIKGCVTQREQSGRIVRLEADTEAHLEDAEWYLSAVGPTIPIDGEPKPCTLQQPKQPAARVR
jgi:hypothetical protein